MCRESGEASCRPSVASRSHRSVRFRMSAHSGQFKAVICMKSPIVIDALCLVYHLPARRTHERAYSIESPHLDLSSAKYRDLDRDAFSEEHKSESRFPSAHWSLSTLGHLSSYVSNGRRCFHDSQPRAVGSCRSVVMCPCSPRPVTWLALLMAP